MNISLIVFIVVIAAVFGLLWWSGQLLRLSAYIESTREELKKCTWPTWEELKGSTAVVMISIAIIGGFTMAVDFVFAMLVRWVT